MIDTRLLLVTPRFPPQIGGVERYAESLARCLSRLGVEVTVFTTSGTRGVTHREFFDEVPIVRFPSLAPGELYYFSWRVLVSLLNASGFDLVHALQYQSFSSLAVALASRRNRIPCVLTTHLGYFKVGLFAHRAYSYVGRFIVQQMAKVIVVSPHEVEVLHRLGVQVRDKAVYVPNGVDQAFFNVARRGNSRKLLFVGRLEKYKGVQSILQALRHLRDEDTELLVAGDGPYRVELESMAQRLGLKQQVSFLGRVHGKRLLGLFEECSLLVLPSLYESLPITVLEALASGMPVICSRIPGLRHLVVDYESGLTLADPTDHLELAEKISCLLGDDARLREYGQKARENVQGFSWENVASKTLEVYRTALGDR
ncbi:MAG: glycosyltransferase family 4 protein [Candidatus Bathyarchaeia archaeon]